MKPDKRLAFFSISNVLTVLALHKFYPLAAFGTNEKWAIAVLSLSIESLHSSCARSMFLLSQSCLLDYMGGCLLGYQKVPLSLLVRLPCSPLRRIPEIALCTDTTERSRYKRIILRRANRFSSCIREAECPPGSPGLPNQGER